MGTRLRCGFSAESRARRDERYCEKFTRGTALRTRNSPNSKQTDGGVTPGAVCCVCMCIWGKQS